MPARRRTGGLVVIIVLALFFTISVVAGCAGCGRGGANATDAGNEGGVVVNDAGVVVDDPSLPATVVIVLEGGIEPDDPRLRVSLTSDGGSAPLPPPVASSSSTSKYVEIMSGLPHPCDDTNKKLGTLTFNQAGEKVIITSSKTRARGTCDKKDLHTLICDWVGPDGKPTVKGKTVTYGIPKKPITGAYDKKNSFNCKAQ
jgi:hypothetical protein